jgi:hypothetical protein
MKKIIFLYLLLLPLTGICQFDNCYFIKLWRIEHLSYDDHDSRSSNIKQLLNLEEQYHGGSDNHYFLLARLYSRENDTVREMDYVKKYLLAGGEPDEDLKISFWLGDSEIKNATVWFKDTVLPKRNFKYIEWIDQFSGFDQNNRKILNRNDPFFKEYLTRVDSFTAESFKVMIQQYGFPKRREIGEAHYGKLFAIMLHIINYEPLYPFFSAALRNAIFSGDLDPENYGAIIDRYQTYTKKEGQLYGCYNIGNNNDFSDIKDMEHLDERRAAIGLAPLQEVLQGAEHNTYFKPANYHYAEHVCY